MFYFVKRDFGLVIRHVRKGIRKNPLLLYRTLVRLSNGLDENRPLE
jgi:hypothetical protein